MLYCLRNIYKEENCICSVETWIWVFLLLLIGCVFSFSFFWLFFVFGFVFCSFCFLMVFWSEVVGSGWGTCGGRVLAVPQWKSSCSLTSFFYAVCWYFILQKLEATLKKALALVAVTTPPEVGNTCVEGLRYHSFSLVQGHMGHES